MIALGGSIGTGLFLVSGYSVSVGGPAGAVFAYISMAVIVYFLMTSLAEMSSFRPSAGSFCDYSSEYVGKSFGIAMGYNYWLSWATAIAVEVSAASLIMGYWFPHINPIIFNAIFFLLIVFANLFVVKIYGEIEYGLSFIKVSAILIFILLGVFSILSTPNFGTNNWNIVGGPFHHGMSGFFAVFLFVGFSFQGTELVGVASEETVNPEITIPRAIKMVFWRLTLFYVLSVIIITLLIPFNDPKLISQDNVLMSPYTLLFQSYIGKYAADVVNFVILMAVISAANASLYSSSRILWYLGKSKQAPAKLSLVNKRGTPFVSLFVTIIISGLFLTTSVIGNGTFFNFVAQISSLAGFLVWLGIALSHYQFRRKYLPLNNIDIKELKYKAKFFPVAPLISIIVILVIVFGQIFTLNKSNIHMDTLLMMYVSVIMFFSVYLIHKTFVYFNHNISKRTALV